MTPVDIAYKFIKERILNGTFRPAQKVTEMQLTEEIGVSRNTVIKALLKLEQENLVAIEKNKGATIKDFTLEEILNYLSIRRVLEGLSIRSAVQHISESNVKQLTEIIAQMKSCLTSNLYDEYSRLNKEFHQIIYEASRNRQAVDLIIMIKTQLSRLHLRTIMLPGRDDESFGEHMRIYEAIATRDADAAEQAIMQHINNISLTIERNYNYLI